MFKRVNLLNRCKYVRNVYNPIDFYYCWRVVVIRMHALIQFCMRLKYNIVYDVKNFAEAANKNESWNFAKLYF